tara:strand:- start:378748 stop:378876 length:129 start_codon:yes stop_codon:yes gene_type:complete
MMAAVYRDISAGGRKHLKQRKQTTAGIQPGPHKKYGAEAPYF